MSKELTVMKAFRLTPTECQYIKDSARLHRMTQREFLKKAAIMFNRYTPITNPDLVEV
ncbi:hypothetical protein VCRA2128O305_10064 [Vibrio crassostreae]|uniref:hypothetical protein n=1 Tax=Vibrio crassostreae TaxID=246167 RepID=UPI0005E1E0C1|nr:hypothetical protein [Vibrio crassostreae]RPF10743.1 hypothetical protein EDB14_1835 [Vibrio crassostreae]TCT67633.1 hypothetical protein EDB44_101681 [Vibrio crassostreae]TCT86936.1 hypothetical protein EDB43_10161 [Vibrio crassostreae]TCU07895.1 hypothetical protein EDB47_10261 [Vibrio crassostreae]TDW13301.1 hypothetical protein EDB45_10160 [Vibrio crassostreae]